MRTAAMLLAFASLLSCSGPQTATTEPAIQQSSEDGPFRLSLSVDRVQISAADSVQLRVEAQYPEGAQAALPSFGAQLGEFLVESQNAGVPRMIADDTLAVDETVTLAPLQPGDLTIPALAASATLEDGRILKLETQAVPVAVSSLFAENDQQDQPELRDIEDPLDPPIPLSWKLGGALAVLLAIAGILWWTKFRERQGSVEPPPPPVPPGEAALARLNALGASGLVESGQYKEFHFELSDILREYIERRFSIHAQEQTTDEFLAGLPQHRVFTPQQQALLQDFLLRSDLVKFAKYAPRTEQSLEASEACRSFIVETDAVGALEGLVK